jgi:YD repeat-containing protein
MRFPWWLLLSAVACSGARTQAPASPSGGASCSVKEEHGGSARAPYTMTFVFDKEGRLVEVSRAGADGNARRTRTLDARGRVTLDSTTEDDASGKRLVTRTMAITRDASGRRSRMRVEETRAATDPIKETVHYEYDDQGRLVRAVTKNDQAETTYLEERAYTRDGTMWVVEGLPDRSAGSVSHMQVRSEGTPARVVSRVLEVREPSPSTIDERFSYDARGRLVRIDGRTTLERPPRSELGAVTFAYDDGGRCVGSEKTYPDEPGTGIVETVKRSYGPACGDPVRRYFDPRSIYESAFDDDDD